MEYKNILMMIGGVTVLFVVGTILYILYESIREKVREWKWIYKRNQRFDKPPTAECYCKDCIYFKEDSHYSKCNRGHIDKTWSIADNYFCWQATPSTYDREK